MKTVLFVCTSCRSCGPSGEEPAGMWFSEFADACRAFLDAGYRVVTASPVGGEIPLAPESENNGAGIRADDFRLRSSTPLERIDPNEFEALYYPGGTGPMWDLAVDNCNAQLLSAFFACGKVIGAVCRGPAALRSRRRDGYPVIHDRRMTGISDLEEQSSGMDRRLPFSLERRLRSGGAYYSQREPGAEYVVTDGNLVTGQNHASAGAAVATMLELMHPAEIITLSARSW